MCDDLIQIFGLFPGSFLFFSKFLLGFAQYIGLHFGRPTHGQPGAVRREHSRRIRREQERGAQDRCHLMGTTQLTRLTIFFGFDAGIARFTALFQESNRGMETGTISFCPREIGRLVSYQST